MTLLPALDDAPGPAWSVACDPSIRPGAEAIAADGALLERVAADGASPIARLWQSRPCIAVPSRLLQLPGYADAARCSAAAGWPIVPRRSGGAPVPLAPGIINLSLAYWLPAARRWSIEDAYRQLADALLGALRPLGIGAEIGAVPEAFCCGRFDLGIGGRKIAGTAQHRRPAGPRGAAGIAVLAQAALLADLDPEPAFAALDRFERALGIRGPWRPGAVTTIRRALQADGHDVRGLTAALLDHLRLSLAGQSPVWRPLRVVRCAAAW